MTVGCDSGVYEASLGNQEIVAFTLGNGWMLLGAMLHNLISRALASVVMAADGYA